MSDISQHPAGQAESHDAAFLEAIGQGVKRRRLEQNLSQGALAAKAGLTQPYVSELESGRMNPKATTIRCLAAALGIDVAEFFKEHKARSRARRISAKHTSPS